MKRHNLLYVGFGLVVLLWALNFIALTFYLYWTVDWYDYLMHFLGGLTLGVLAVWMLRVDYRSSRAFLHVFLVVMAIGVAWEIFEYLNGMTYSVEYYPLDIAHDLMMDALGMATAYYSTTSQTQLSS